MGMPGISELLVIFAVVLLLFGGKKLPQLGGALGESGRSSSGIGGRGGAESREPGRVAVMGSGLR